MQAIDLAITPSGMGAAFDVSAALDFGRQHGADMALFAELIQAGRAGAFAGMADTRERRRESRGE